MPQWLRTDNKEGDGTGSGDRTIEIKPEQIREALKDDLGKIGDLSTSMSAVMDFINEQKADKQRKDEEAEAARRAADNKTDDIDWLNDPEGATKKTMRPLIEGQAAMAAMLMRKETLGDMDYYKSDPDFKAKVDTLIDQQPLGLRSNASVIMNAYKSVYFDMRQEISEGKVKSAMSMNSNNGGGSGTGKQGSDGGDSDITMTAEEKQYARKLGISENDWMKQKKELEYV
jgi:hypothetical protein